MRVLHVSDSDGHGGAARAAFRIHRSLVAVEQLTGVESHMLVHRSVQDDPRVFAISPTRFSAAPNRVAGRLTKAHRRLLRTENRVLHSTALVPTPTLRRIREFAPDAVVLHWLGNSILSVAQVGRLSRLGIPVFWFLHDTWAFCGAEHYPHGSADRRFVEGYRRDNQPSWESGFDVNRATWNRKRRHWTQPMHLIAPSRWIAEVAKSSALMRSWPVDIVPNPLEVEWWSGLAREEARRQLKISRERRIILFGAIGGEKDLRKGADLLRASLARLSKSLSRELKANLEVLTFGGKQSIDNASGLPIRSIGRLNDQELRLYYSAADVMVVPSRQEAFGQTASEALCCGTPVVAFRVGGLPDLVDDGVNGRLVKPFSTEAMSEAIGWLLEDDSRRESLSRRARESAEKWNAERVGGRLAEVLAGAASISRGG